MCFIFTTCSACKMGFIYRGREGHGSVIRSLLANDVFWAGKLSSECRERLNKSSLSQHVVWPLGILGLLSFLWCTSWHLCQGYDGLLLGQQYKGTYL